MAHKKYKTTTSFATVIANIKSFYTDIIVYYETSTVFVFKIPSLSDRVMKLNFLSGTSGYHVGLVVGDEFDGTASVTNPQVIVYDQAIGIASSYIGSFNGFETFLSANSIVIVVSVKGAYHDLSVATIISKMTNGNTAFMGFLGIGTATSGSISTFRNNLHQKIWNGLSYEDISIYLSSRNVRVNNQFIVRNIDIKSGLYASPFDVTTDAQGNPLYEFVDIFVADYTGSYSAFLTVGKYEFLPRLPEEKNGANHGSASIALEII